MIDLPVLIRDRLTLWGYENNHELATRVYQVVSKKKPPEYKEEEAKFLIEEFYDDEILMVISDYQVETVMVLSFFLRRPALLAPG